MSAIRKLSLPQVKDTKTLRDALVIMNTSAKEHIAYNATRRGLWSTREEHGCALVLRRELFNGVEDVAWVRHATGDLHLVYDSDDEDALDMAFGGSFETSIAQYYAAASAKAQLELEGYGCEVAKLANGELQVVGTSWA